MKSGVSCVILQRQLINTGVGIIVQVRIRLNHKGERCPRRPRRHKGVRGRAVKAVLPTAPQTRQAIVIAGVGVRPAKRDIQWDVGRAGLRGRSHRERRRTGPRLNIDLHVLVEDHVDIDGTGRHRPSISCPNHGELFSDGKVSASHGPVCAIAAVPPATNVVARMNERSIDLY